ncbi:AAA family ATPase [Fulvivirga sp.]|uniref:AAA family ATPase n=1 Tax=Fulvivirga sp. TaxID=1931237 RepID=UPI0032EC966F
MNKMFFTIPQLKEVEVSDYPLFTGNWKYEIKSGLNLFLGVNAIGKTTTIKMIVFGFVGTYDESKDKKIDSQFFTERVNTKNDYDARIKLSFSLADQEIVLERSINSGGITYLTLNGDEVSSDDLDEIYLYLLNEHGNIDQIDDLTFLLQNLLIREEEGNYLFWSQEEQSKVIRMLASDKSLEFQYKAIEEKLQKADSAYKRITDSIPQIRKRMNALIETKKEKEAGDKDQTVSKLKEELKGEIQKRDNLLDHRTVELKRYDDLDINIQVMDGQISDLSAKLSEANQKYRSLNRQFYSGSFTTEQYRYEMIHDKLDSLSICSICNTHLSSEKAKKVLEAMEAHSCPLCDSQINIDSEDVEQADIELIQRLHDLIKKYNVDINSSQQKYDDYYSQLLESRENIDKYDQEIKQLNLSIVDKKKAISINENTGEEAITDLDIMIDRYQKEINEIKKDSEELLNAKNEVIKEAEQINEKLNEQIENFRKRLVEIFVSYARIYFEDNHVDLYLREGFKPRGLEISLSYFLPKLGGTERIYKNRVSTSEANILEYIFRITLLQLYGEITGYRPMTIMETSEGSFDIDKTLLLADTIKEFGKNDFPITIITNLSKADFILQILPEETRKERTFLILKYSRLSDKAEKFINKELDKLEII